MVHRPVTVQACWPLVLRFYSIKQKIWLFKKFTVPCIYTTSALMSCRFQMIRIYLLRLLEITYSHLTTCPKSVKSAEHIDSSFFFIMMYYEISSFSQKHGHISLFGLIWIPLRLLLVVPVLFLLQYGKLFVIKKMYWISNLVATLALKPTSKLDNMYHHVLISIFDVPSSVFFRKHPVIIIND